MMFCLLKMICLIIINRGEGVNIAVFFGGESCEHDISIITGGQFIANCDSNVYNVIPVYISKNGDWFTGDDLKDIDNFNQKDYH